MNIDKLIHDLDEIRDKINAEIRNYGNEVSYRAGEGIKETINDIIKEFTEKIIAEGISSEGTKIRRTDKVLRCCENCYEMTTEYVPYNEDDVVCIYCLKSFK